MADEIEAVGGVTSKSPAKETTATDTGGGAAKTEKADEGAKTDTTDKVDKQKEDDKKAKEEEDKKAKEEEEKKKKEIEDLKAQVDQLKQALQEMQNKKDEKKAEEPKAAEKAKEAGGGGGAGDQAQQANQWDDILTKDIMNVLQEKMGAMGGLQNGLGTQQAPGLQQNQMVPGMGGMGGANPMGGFGAPQAFPAGGGFSQGAPMGGIGGVGGMGGGPTASPATQQLASDFQQAQQAGGASQNVMSMCQLVLGMNGMADTQGLGQQGQGQQLFGNVGNVLGNRAF